MREKLRKALMYKKVERKMLMKLTPSLGRAFVDTVNVSKQSRISAEVAEIIEDERLAKVRLCSRVLFTESGVQVEDEHAAQRHRSQQGFNLR